MIGTLQQQTPLTLPDSLRLLELASDYFYILEKDYKGNKTLHYLSPSCVRITGYTAEELVAMRDPLVIVQEDMPSVMDYLTKVSRGGTHICVYRIKHKSGKIVWLEDKATGTLKPDGSLKMMGVVRDITAQREAQTKLEAAITQNNVINAQKEALLKDRNALIRELQHRVQNNLQVISSLLQIQRSKIADEKVGGVLNIAKRRIDALFLAHQLLNHRGAISELKLSQYIVTYTTNLIAKFNTTDCKTGPKRLSTDALHFDVDDVTVSANAITPLSLIIAEIVANSFCYAFDNHDNPKLTVRLKRINGSYYNLEIADNGPGFSPEDITACSLGLSFVSLLANQIDAQYTYETANGVRHSLIAKL